MRCRTYIPLYITLVLSLILPVLSQTASGNTSALPIGSCTSTIPCGNGACCNGDSGFCGFGSAFCTPVAAGGSCTSNCDAKAECGPNAAPQNFTCPLNVCCSQFGFCGTTTEFCGAGCQSNCNPPSQESCGPDQQSALHRRIGYYEGWAVTRSCSAFAPEQIVAEALTHINFAFALISDSFQITEMAANDNLLWMRTTALKKRNIALKVFLSIGGWTFNDPPTSTIFSQLAASAENTQTFIASALAVMQAYGFDGIDIDWEYPGAYDRGGNPADTANYVTFMSKVKSAFKSHGYGLTFTAPSSYWYLQHFDLPGLLQHADWVNVMTYDLHGVWDGIDPFVGHIVLAHTNLTEIRATMQLYRNVGINPDQMVLGIGFYGRSFQLADPGCSAPGCGFSGPAAPGPCSGPASAGTLMFSEIESIINTNGLEPVFDEAAGVKYIVWNDNQWVSFDDPQTLQMKLDYANSICLSGTMVWSVDQDDMLYTALSGLYGSVVENTPSEVLSGNECFVTGCGEACPEEYSTMTVLSYNPTSGKSCSEDHLALLCCPFGDQPQNCEWRGGGGHTCNAQCDVGEIVLATDIVGGDGTPTCIQGYKAYCCQSGEVDPLACFATGCGEAASACPADYIAQTFVKQGSSDNSGCEARNEMTTHPQICPAICPSNNKPVCCLENAGYTNCQWVGDPPNCQNAVCQSGQVAIFSDIQGDASQTCVGLGKRFYCCDPPSGASFLPIPEDWVFPEVAPVPGAYSVNQPATFTVDFDDDPLASSAPDSAVANFEEDTGGDTGGEDTGEDNVAHVAQEDITPFGEVFISSPNPASVSSMTLQSDWVITGCLQSSDQPQEVLAYCSMSMDDEESGCNHVFIGQAEHTIVRMPSTCGQGPYARIVSLMPHPDQTILSTTYHQSRIPPNEQVYSLKFDYNFLAIPESNGPVLMRADITDIPDYWTAVINSPPDPGTTTTRRKRDFHQPEELERRWFGPFDTWLKKVTTLSTGNSVSRVFSWSDTYTIFHQEEACPHFMSSLDISVDGRAQVRSLFGYYLEASVVPPSIQQAYVYLQAGASAQATFTVTGLASANFDSEKAELISFGFPGLSYPGLLTLGPSLHLYGQLIGQLSMSGKLSSSVGYTFPSLDLSFGKMDSNNDEENFGPTLKPNNQNNGYDYSFGYNVNLEGKAEVHVVPSLQLGLSVLGGRLMDAQVFVEGDLYGGVGINGSVSKTSALTFCVQPYFGVNLNGGLTGSVLFWRDNAITTPFYTAQFPFGGECFGSMDQSQISGAGGNDKREFLGPLRENDYTHGRRTDKMVASAHQGTPLKTQRQSSGPASVALSSGGNRTHITSGLKDNNVFNETSPTLLKRAGVPFLPGNLFCPETGTDITNSTNGTDCSCYDDSSANDPSGPGSLILSQQLAFSVNNSGISKPLHILTESSLRTCPNVDIPIPSYSTTPVVAYYDLADPTGLDPTYAGYVPGVPVNLGTNANGQPFMVIQGGKVVYAREHPYEVSMAALFVDFLQQQTDLWNNSTGDQVWCTWVAANLGGNPGYLPPQFNGNTMFEQLSECYPSDDLNTPMVILEQNANVIKRNAYFSTELVLNHIDQAPVSVRAPAKFRTYCPKKQVAVLRNAAGVTSFLNSPPVRDIFLQMNTCIRNTWTAWYIAYVQANVDAPNRRNFNLPSEYNTWVHSIISNVPSFLFFQVQNLITIYNEADTDDGNTLDVDLSWGVLLDERTLNAVGQPISLPTTNYAVDVPVSRDDLTNHVLNAIQPINWINSLPSQ